MQNVKGSKIITLGGKEYELVPSFRGLQEIEKKADAGLVSILSRAAKKDIRVTDMAAVIYGGMLGNRAIKQKDRLEFEEIGDLITEHGMMGIVSDVLLFLSDIVMAGHEEQPAGEAEGKDSPAREHA